MTRDDWTQTTLDPTLLVQRAEELAARADELAREAESIAGSDEELARLEGELAALEEEKRLLDRDFAEVRNGGRCHRRNRPHGWGRGWARRQAWDNEPQPFAGFAATMASRLSVIGTRIGESMTEAFSTIGPRASDSIERTLPVDGPVSVRVENFAGSVAVRAGAGTDGRVSAVAARYAPRHTDLDDIGLDVRADGPGQIAVVCAGSAAAWFARHARLTVTVPRGTATEVSTSGGTVTVDGTGAGVRARTAGGSIHISATTGEAEAETVGGSIHVADHDGPVTARTLGGSIHLAGRLTGPVGAETQGGSITVVIPADSNLRVDGRGTSSSSDFAEVTAYRGGLEGVVGDGSDGTVSLRTVGGSVVLRRMT